MVYRRGCPVNPARSNRLDINIVSKKVLDGSDLMRPFDDRTEPKSRMMTLETLIDQKIGEISTTKHGRTEKNNRRFWIKVAKNQSKNFDDVFVAEQKMLA